MSESPLQVMGLSRSRGRAPPHLALATPVLPIATGAGHHLAAREIVTDDVDAIRAVIKRWIADAGVDAVITTGGTGFTGRDALRHRARLVD